MHSCLYRGNVTHTRAAPFRHTFRYNLFLVYLDLAELETVFSGRWLWSTRRFNLAWFCRADHLGNPDQSLDCSVRELVAERTGRMLTGPIRLLTHLRYFGFVMNPVSFYFCFDESDSRVEAVVAEVTNTPWGERHCYVIERSDNDNAVIQAQHPKEFHVSPFLPMEMSYRWRIGQSGDGLAVKIENVQGEETVFDAALSLKRRPMSSFGLAAALLRYPLMTFQVLAAIYWQALRLWWRGATYFPHPQRKDEIVAGDHSVRSDQQNQDIENKEILVS
jgi:DUF1365 family protein